MQELRFHYRVLTLVLALLTSLAARIGIAMQDCVAEDYTYAIAFSSNGEHILAGWHPGTIRLWDVQSGKILRDFSYNTDHTFSVAFTPDSKFVLAGGYTGAYMWEIESGEFVRTFPAQINFETDIGRDTTIIKITPDSRYLLTSTTYGARLWSLQTGDELLNLTSETPDLFNTDLSHDGRYVLVEREDGVRLWDAKTGSEVHYFGEGSFNATFSHDGRFILVGTDSGVELWETVPLATHGYADLGQYLGCLCAGRSAPAYHSRTDVGHFRAGR